MKNLYQAYRRSVPGIFIMSIMLLSSPVLHAQEAKLNFKIKFNIVKGKLDNALISITRDGQPYRVIDPNKGKYILDLEMGSDFVFTFTKMGYISKSVIVDTHIPKGREEEYFNEFIADVTLEPQPEDKIITYSQPVGKVKYSNSVGDFDFDNDYTATAKEQQEKDKERAVPKPKDPTPNPRPVTVAKEAPALPPSKPIAVAVKQPEYKSEPEKIKRDPPLPDPPSKPVVKDKEERIIQKDRLKITLVTVKIDGVEFNYKKEEYSWGGTYFYKNERNITESAFFKETE
jgi:hypothetical protein